MSAPIVTLASALPHGVPIRTGRRLIHEGKLPAVKIGREYYVDPRDVAELFKPVRRGARHADHIRAGGGPYLPTKAWFDCVNAFAKDMRHIGKRVDQ